MKARLRKRLFLICILSAMLVVTVACGGGTAPTPTAAPAEKKAEPAPAKAPPAAPKSDFPKSPIRLIVTHAAGGSTDLIVRLFQPYLQEALGGNPVVVENMVGAGGNIARNFVYKAKPDGYALLISQFPSMMIGEIAQGGQFKTLEMTPIAQLTGKQTQALAVHPNHAAKTFKELVDASKAKRLSVAGPGLGTNGHLAWALFRKAGLNSEYIPFDGGNQTTTAVVGKQVDAGSMDSVLLPALIKDNKIRVLTHAGIGPDDNAPGVPNLVQAANLPGAAFEISIGLMAPPATPVDVVTVLSSAIDKALNNKDFLEKAKKGGYEASFLNPEHFKKANEANYKLVEGFKADLSAPAPAKK